MGLLDRLRELLGRGAVADDDAARQETLHERILSTPGEREQRSVTDEADRARVLDQGDLPPGDEP